MAHKEGIDHICTTGKFCEKLATSLNFLYVGHPEKKCMQYSCCPHSSIRFEHRGRWGTSRIALVAYSDVATVPLFWLFHASSSLKVP